MKPVVFTHVYCTIASQTFPKSPGKGRFIGLYSGLLQLTFRFIQFFIYAQWVFAEKAYEHAQTFALALANFVSRAHVPFESNADSGMRLS